MSIGKQFLRLGTTGAAAAALLTATHPALAAVPMPDPVARIPVVGLLPRWTWDPLWAEPPASGLTHDTEVDRAIAFVRDLLADEFPEGIDVVAAYRLDGDELVAVEVTTHSGIDASFTVALLDPDSEPAARLVRDPP